MTRQNVKSDSSILHRKAMSLLGAHSRKLESETEKSTIMR